MNSIRANCTSLKIEISENNTSDLLSIFIEDDGDGMSKDFLEKVIDPFTTTRTTRKVGLGIPLMKANSESCDGMFNIYSELGKGTNLQSTFKHSHIDRPIMGDIASVAGMLFSSHPEVNIQFIYNVDNKEFSLSSEEIKQELGEVSIQEPEVKIMIESILKTELDEIGAEV